MIRSGVAFYALVEQKNMLFWRLQQGERASWLQLSLSELSGFHPSIRILSLICK